jgi:integrase
MRISKALQLRVKDVDFSHQALIVREGKGGKDRVVMLAQSLAQPLRGQARRFARQHCQCLPHLTRCATASRRTCCKTDTTFAQFRTCSDTPTWQRP